MQYRRRLHRLRPVWEGFMLAAMDQIKLLWPEGKHALPIIFNINDNFYGMGGQTQGRDHGLRYGGAHSGGHIARTRSMRSA